MTTIRELFEQQVARTPKAVACLFNDRRVTYDELNARANRVARLLARRRIGPEDAVAVCMANSIDLVAVLLGIVKMGAAFVGLDPLWPSARRYHALRDSRARLLVVDASESSSPDRFSGETIALDVDGPRLATEPAEPPAPAAAARAIDPDSLFSIVYTSGSTGAPKGVLITMRAVVNRMEWMWDAYPFRPGDTALLYRSCSSVGFSWDCFGALLRETPTLIVPAADLRDPAEILRWSIAYSVSHLSASASLWDLILQEAERAGGWPSLRVGRSTGEPLRPETIERWRRVLPQASLVNVYGASECCGSTAYDTTAWNAARRPRVPVGVAIPGVQALVVDERLRSCTGDQRGEVCIAGASLARGYLGQPALTAEWFVPHPAGAVPGERIYRTRDVGRWGADGLLDILGRRDLQIKLRGYRVEVEEVEAALRACPGITAAAVDVHQDENGAALVAYVTTDDPPPSAGDLREALLERLPGYMVPSWFIRVAALPRTATGKIDRRAVAGLNGDLLESTVAFVRPSTASERAVATLWERILEIDEVGLHDNFFELGGHSLAGARILARVTDAFGVQIPLRVLFESPTIKSLAAEIDAALAARAAAAAPAPPRP